MVKFEQLNEQEQTKVREEAMKFFQPRKNQIYKNLEKDTPKVAPSGSDLFHPELWKSIHWKWFLDNSFLL